MANRTVYPYGTDGQLPSSIGIVNDLYTGGADKALSAQMGRVLNTEMNGEYYDVQVPYLDNAAINYVISASDLWGASTYQSVFVTVNPGEQYKLILNNNPGTLAFLKSKTYADGVAPDFSASHPHRYTVDNMPTAFVIPEDTHYLCLRKTTSGGTTDLDLYLIDTRGGLRGRIGEIGELSLNKADLDGIWQFYINASTGKWTKNSNAHTYSYKLLKGQTLTIKANPSMDASLAFLSVLNPQNNVSASFANGTSGVITQAASTTQSYTVSEDCYLYIFQTGASASTSRYPDGIFIRMDGDTFVSESGKREDIGAWEYFGEKPRLGGKSYGLKKLASLPLFSGYTGLHQGMAISGDYAVLFTYSDAATPSTCTAVLYDIPTESKLVEINLPYSTYMRPHGNALSFGKGLHSANSVVPPLYVSQWDESGERGVLVYDITLTGNTYSASLIQAIIPSIDGSVFGNGYADWVVDAESESIYSVTYMLAENGPYLDDDATNPTMICKFALPALSSSLVTLAAQDIEEHYSIRSLPYRQDLCASGGYLMIQRGNQNAGYADWLDVQFLDLAARSIQTVVPLKQFGGETEGLAMYQGHLVIGWRNSADIYSFDF